MAEDGYTPNPVEAGLPAMRPLAAVSYFAVITDNLVMPARSMDAIARATSP